jgi:AraC-like DNA-binding protein
MQAASLSLRFTEATIAEVADQFNYDSQQTFTRAFSRHFGMPPGIWRITDAAKKIR